MSETLTGQIERVTFHNSENGFAVLRVKVKGHQDLVTVVGNTTSVSAGEHFEAVAEIMQPRRRRRLSPEARQRLAEAGAKTRFGHGTHDAGAAPESQVGVPVVF